MKRDGIKRTITLCSLFMLWIMNLSCSADEELLSTTVFRSESDAQYYLVNNELATKRVQSIRYTDAVQQIERFKLVHLSDPHPPISGLT